MVLDYRKFLDSQDGRFEIFKFLINRQIGGLMCIVIPYFTKIGQTVAEISHLTIFKMTAVRHLGSPPKDKKLRKLSGWPIWAHNYGLKINAVKYENSHDAAPVCALFVPNCAHPTGGSTS